MKAAENIQRLRERQTALEATMRKSDARASKCAKLGLVFRDEYPVDYAEYVAARDEYNANETRLAALGKTLAEELANEAAHPADAEPPLDAAGAE